VLSAAELRDWIREHFTAEAFRLETLQTYEVASDGSDYRRYLDGAPTWTPERKGPWLDRLADEHARGLRRRRVRIVTRPVTPYTRYECEWGYAPNATAGEDIRILDLAERDVPAAAMPLTGHDWWLLTDHTGTPHVRDMHYGADGSFVGASEPGRAVHYVSARDALWAAAEPFAPWWERHRELHRDGAHAA